MPWPTDAIFYNFNEFSIVLNAKPEYGVYALFDAERRPILIDCGTIMQDLMRLAEGAEREFKDSPPVSFSYVVAPMEEALALKKTLVAELTAKKLAKGA